MRRSQLLYALTALAATALPVSADTQVLLADGRSLDRATLKPGPTANQVIVEQPGASPLTVTPQDLLVVDFGKIPGRELPPTVRMANGDQVVGKVSFPNPRTVKIAAGWGSVTLPLRSCAAIRFNDKVALPGSVTKDTLVLATDRVEGDIESIANGKVTINLAGKSVPLDLARVEALALAPRARSENASGLQLGIDLGGGEKITGKWVALTPDILTVKPEWGENLDIPVASISRLEVKNGKLVYLSALKPAEVKYTPYLETSLPYKVDRAVSGRPLRLSGKVFNRGLGVHSKTELTYTLDGSYQSFASMVGIDDAVVGGGSVVFRVFGDDKPLFESPVMRGGDPSVEVKVNLKGVLQLRLEVDYADDGDAGDHADWADARLLRG